MTKTSVFAALAGAIGLASVAFGAAPAFAAPVSSAGMDAAGHPDATATGMVIEARHYYGRPHYRGYYGRPRFAPPPYGYGGRYRGPRRDYGPPRFYGPPPGYYR
jgi:hypothetical protein